MKMCPCCSCYVCCCFSRKGGIAPPFTMNPIGPINPVGLVPMTGTLILPNMIMKTGNFQVQTHPAILYAPLVLPNMIMTTQWNNIKNMVANPLELPNMILQTLMNNIKNITANPIQLPNMILQSSLSVSQENIIANPLQLPNMIMNSSMTDSAPSYSVFITVLGGGAS